MSAYMSARILAFAKLTVKNPFLMVILALLLVASAGFGAQWIEFNTNYRVFFTDNNPQMAAFDEIERVYTKTDNILFTIKPKSGTVFEADTLNLIQDLTTDSWRLPYAQRVDSLTNFQYSYAEEDDLIVQDMVEEDPQTLNEDDFARIRSLTMQEPTLVGKLINHEGSTTGVNVLVNLPRTNMAEVPEAAQAARALVTKYRALYPEIDIRPSGFLFMNNAFMESSLKDMQTLMPLMFLALIAIMLFLVRSITATFATLLIIMFSAIAALGFGGWVGFPLTPPSAITPTIVLTLAIADSIHIIISMLKAMQTGMAKKEAIVEAVRVNFQPVFLTSLTTVVGFLSLNFSEAPPFWHLGNMTAFGIAIAFILSVTLLPALLSLLPIKVKPRPADRSSFMEKFGQFVVRRNKSLLLLMMVLTAVFGSMISRIEINDQFVQYFDKSISFRPDTEFMMKNLSGVYATEYSIRASGPEQITDPAYLSHVEDFSNWLRTQPEVDHVFSITDIFKRLNKNMHADDPAWYRLPQEQALASQYLLLYEFSLPYGLDLTDRINIDKSASRLTVTLKDISTKDLRAFKARSEEWLQQHTPTFMHAEATSPAVMFSFISDRNIRAMVNGNIVSLLMISGIILLALRSISLGFMSLIPNLTPLAVGFGLWGLFIGQINMAVAFAFAVCLGIIVDDTVHFLSKYIRARREKGLEAPEAIVYAFSTVGTALVVTTVILIGGFMVLSQSGFQMNSYMGLLASLVIGSALVLDFFLLPSLLILVEDLIKKFKKG